MCVGGVDCAAGEEGGGRSGRGSKEREKQRENQENINAKIVTVMDFVEVVKEMEKRMAEKGARKKR